MPAKVHTVATVAAEMVALPLPGLTEQASLVLVGTLLRETCNWVPMLITAEAEVSTADRTKVMRKAKSLYL